MMRALFHIESWAGGVRRPEGDGYLFAQEFPTPDPVHLSNWLVDAAALGAILLIFLKIIDHFKRRPSLEQELEKLLKQIRTELNQLAAANDGRLGPGVVVKVICGTRSYAEQTALYAQGRTTPGRIVTDAPAGYSNHNFGIAFDVGIFNCGEYLDDSPLYAQVGALGRSQGLVWGGDWSSFPDEPHFQLPYPGTLAEARASVAGGIWGKRWV